MTDEFEVRRNGKPLLLILGPFGPTWCDRAAMFDRPIEKIGASLSLWKNGVCLSEDRSLVIKVVTHWKRVLNRKMKATGEPLETFLLTGPYEDE